MATIRERKGKSGSTYRIQVLVKNEGTGQREAKAFTWKPPKGMSETEIARELKKQEVEFEDACRKAALATSGIDMNVTVKAFSVNFLESIKRSASP